MKDETLIAELADGQSVAAIARKTGRSERTIWRRLRDEGFRKRVEAARREAFKAAIGALQSRSAKAAATLAELLDDRNAGIRLRASVAILDTASRLGTMADLEERVAQLESQHVK